MDKKLPLYLQSCHHFFKVNFKKNLLAFFSLLFISLSAFSQGPGCPNVYAGEDVELGCGEPCTDLTASFLDTGETTSYEVSSIPFDPPFPFTGLANPISVGMDDVFSDVIPLPFEFCYFDNIYSEVIIGSNGIISFDLSLADDFCSFTLGDGETIPTTAYHPNAIMLFHDMDPRFGNAEVGYEVLGVAPCRTLVVSFANVPYYNFDNPNNAAISTFQMVLYETTNAIDFYVLTKPDPNDFLSAPINGGRSVLGIQNQNGNQGFTPPNRNTSVWEATEEAWRFTPNGASNVAFSWLDSMGTVIGTDTTINVCPTDQSTTYTAQAVYTNCNGDVITETDEITVTRIGSFTVDLGGDQELCDAESYDITAEITGGDPTDATFLWNTGETTQTITVTTSGTYSVDVTIGTCTISASVVINFNELPLIELGDNIETCFFDPIILDASPSNYDPTDATYEWSLDGVVLAGETNPTLNATQYGVYSVNVSANGCLATDEVTISPQTLNVALGDDFTSCFEIPETLTAEAIDFDPATATFEWSLDGIVIAGETNQTLNITEPGTYVVTATVNSCTATDTIVVGLGNIEVTVNDDFQTCFESQVQLEAMLTVQNPEATYQWSLDGNIIPDETNSTLIITEVGTYTVTATVGSCSASDSVTVSFRDDLEVTLDEDFKTCPNELQILTATTDEEDATFQWFLNGDIIAGETNKTLEFSLETGTFGTQTFEVVISVGGCSGTDSVDVTLYEVGNCIISEGLSPNGDGFNDTLDLTFLNDRTGISKLQIFNRLGTLVFEQNNYTNQWRGQTNDGEDLPTGTYFYVIDLAGNDAVYGSQATGWIYLNQEAN